MSDDWQRYPPVSLVKAVALFLQTAPGMRVTFCIPPGIDQAPWKHAVKEAGITPVVAWVQPEDLEGLLQVISAGASGFSHEQAWRVFARGRALRYVSPLAAQFTAGLAESPDELLSMQLELHAS